MKKQHLILWVIMILVTGTLPAAITSRAAGTTVRVIYQVEVLSEQSAKLTLKWSDDTVTIPIRIISWAMEDDQVLKVTYETGKNVIEGWNSRKIEGENYHFPMKIILEEQGKESANLSDLPTTDQEKYAILNLYDRGIINGYPDGSFKPGSFVKRSEFAKMLTLAAQYGELKTPVNTFKDVPSTHWAYGFVSVLADKGILKGKGSGLFKPDDNITIGEVLAVLNRTFIFYGSGATYPYTLEPHFSNGDFTRLVEAGIVLKSDAFYQPYAPNQKASRQLCAVLLSRVLEKFHEAK